MTNERRRRCRVVTAARDCVQKTRIAYENTQRLHVLPGQICSSEANSGNLGAYLQTCVHTCPRAVNTITRTDFKMMASCAQEDKVIWSERGRFLEFHSFSRFSVRERRQTCTHSHLGSFGGSDRRPAPQRDSDCA